jgi:hypothetical protein
MSLIDTRAFYPVVTGSDVCAIIEDFGGPQSVFHQNAAWQAVYDLGLYRQLQGFYGRGCRDLIESGLISGVDSDQREHRKTVKIEWETDDQEVEGLPDFMPVLYREEGEDLDSLNDRLCDWLSDSTGWLVAGYEFVPQAVEGDDNEYHLENVKTDQITAYVDLGEDQGVLLVSGMYAFGFGSQALYVYVDSEGSRQYVCIDDTILYLDTLEKLENPQFKEVV